MAEDVTEPATRPTIEQRVRRNLGRALFVARWLMVPFYVGLLGALGLLAFKFVQKLIAAVLVLPSQSSDDTIFTVLSLVDLSLVANLVVIVIFAGWENFVGRFLKATADEQPDWLGTLNFGALKLKLLASIIAIASILILETFVHIDEVPKQDAAWQLAILLGLGVTGLLLAAMDRLGNDK